MQKGRRRRTKEKKKKKGTRDTEHTAILRGEREKHNTQATQGLRYREVLVDSKSEGGRTRKSNHTDIYTHTDRQDMSD